MSTAPSGLRVRTGERLSNVGGDAAAVNRPFHVVPPEHVTRYIIGLHTILVCAIHALYIGLLVSHLDAMLEGGSYSKAEMHNGTDNQILDRIDLRYGTRDRTHGRKADVIVQVIMIKAPRRERRRDAKRGCMILPSARSRLCSRICRLISTS